MDVAGNKIPGGENNYAKALGWARAAVFQALQGWAQRAGAWVREAAGKLDKTTLGQD